MMRAGMMGKRFGAPVGGQGLAAGQAMVLAPEAAVLVHHNSQTRDFDRGARASGILARVLGGGLA